MKALSSFLPNRESLPKTRLDYISLIFLFLCMLFFLMPLYVMVVTGLKDSTHVSLSTMWNLPTRLSGGGFIEAWQRLLPNLGNSLMLAIPATAISSIIGSINGYLFAKWKFPGANVRFRIPGIWNVHSHTRASLFR